MGVPSGGGVLGPVLRWNSVLRVQQAVAQAVRVRRVLVEQMSQGSDVLCEGKVDERSCSQVAARISRDAIGLANRRADTARQFYTQIWLVREHDQESRTYRKSAKMHQGPHL